MKVHAFNSRFLLLCCSFVFLIGANNAFSADDPIKMLESVTDKVFTELKSHREELRNDRSRVYKLVYHIILPHVDFDETAKWVVGRNAWLAADARTQKHFINEFKTLVVRSYAGSLLNYDLQKIKFQPLRGVQNKERIEVTSFIKSSGKSDIRISYRLIKSKGEWRVYDIIIEGVSLMQGYRAQFAEDVKKGGVPAVIEKIRSKNVNIVEDGHG